MEVPYVQGDKLKDDENEKCKIYNVYGREETIFEHCIRAIEKGINLGNNNLPKIGSGDWNDGFSNIGDKGKGESIWLGFFLYDILKRFEEILKKLGKNELIERYKIVRDVLKKSLNTFAWDGQWYIRAVTDTGEIIGSSKNEECKIDSISQSWSVISEAGDNDKKFIAMDSVYKYLVDMQKKFLKCVSKEIEAADKKEDYINLIYTIRYYRNIHLTQNKMIKEIPELNNTLNKIGCKLITIMCKKGIFRIFCRDIAMNYKIILQALNSSIVDIDDIDICLKLQDDDEISKLFIEIYDNDTIDSSLELDYQLDKKDLSVRQKKHVPLVNF